MKKVFPVLSIMLLCMFAAAAVAYAKKVNSESYQTETRTIDVGQISEIEAGIVDLVITPGRGSGTAQLSGPVYLLDKVKVRTAKSKLEIYIKDGRIRKGDSVKLVITADVHAIEAYAGSKVTFTAPVSSSRSFSVEAYASASVDIPALTAAKVDIEAYSAGNVRIPMLESRGDLEIDSYSGGVVKIDKANAPKSEFESYSGGKINILSGSLGTCDFEAYSGGEISVKAATATVKQESYSGGSISIGK